MLFGNSRCQEQNMTGFRSGYVTSTTLSVQRNYAGSHHWRCIQGILKTFQNISGDEMTYFIKAEPESKKEAPQCLT
eukprot:9227293-Ditylum_brightwellii.AAC.1